VSAGDRSSTLSDDGPRPTFQQIRDFTRVVVAFRALSVMFALRLLGRSGASQSTLARCRWLFAWHRPATASAATVTDPAPPAARNAPRQASSSAGLNN